MKTNERVGVAVAAATVGAVVGTAVSARGRRGQGPRRPEPLQLLARNPTHGPRTPIDLTTLSPVDDLRDVIDRVEDKPTIPTAGPAAPRMIAVSSIANAISLMAIGALITLLVLWVTGTWDGSTEAVAQTLPVTTVLAAPPPSPSRTDLPVTAADVVQDGTEVAPEAESDAAVAVEPDRPDPTQIEIPAVGINASVIGLGLTDTGALEVPEDFSQTGWWTGGAEPGETGPAVVVGHVDSFQGPAVFFRLRDLAYDDTIVITRGDGSSATFAVRSSISVEKDAFPTELVYGDTDESILRLITCNGDFADGSYLGNLIVTAELIEENAPPRSGVTY